MITTKADKLLKSLIDASLSLTDFTILAIKIIHFQQNLKIDNEDRRQRDRVRQQDKLREQYHLEQELKEEEQRKIKGLAKLRELGYVTNDDVSQMPNNSRTESIDQFSVNKDMIMNADQTLSPYSKEINDMKQKQRSCCIIFNIDSDLRLHQQALEQACRRAKRNIYELRADRFNRPEHRSILCIETITSHSKLKQAIREINKIFLDSKANEDKRYLQELLTYINQFEGDIDLLMCQMQYEPKVKETILFSSVTNDILDRMNLILNCARTLSDKISNDENISENNDDLEKELSDNLLNIPTKANYVLKIKTNDEISSSLSDETQVAIKLYGTWNKTSDIHLTQSNNKAKWLSGQIDVFNVELNYLGDIYAIEIWHNSQYAAWKVDWIEVIDDAANIYRFPVNRLFDKYSHERKTRFIVQRDMGPVTSLPSKPFKQVKPYRQVGFSTYTVQVKTGKQPNKATDSLIFIQVKGENGVCADNLCSANSALKNSVFEPNQLDKFYLVWPNLGRIDTLQLFIQSEGMQPLWFCEYVIIEDDQTYCLYKFTINQLFDGSNPDNKSLLRYIMVHPENIDQKDASEEKQKPGYLLKIKTGEKGLVGAASASAVQIAVIGEKGKSETLALKPLNDNKTLFQQHQTDEFLLASKYYVGSIKAIELSAPNLADRWFIETIVVRDIMQGQDYVFPIFNWINTTDGKNTLNIHPLSERKADYIIYVRTVTSVLKGPDRAIKLLVHGTKGSHEIELHNPVTMHNTFQSGHKDEYHIENMKSLGDLQSLEIDITHPNIQKLGLDYIEINDLKTNDSYRFNINRMLDSKTPKFTSKAEPIQRFSKNVAASITKTSPSVILTKKNFDQLAMDIPHGGTKAPINNNFTISIKSADSSLMGMDSKVQLQLYGDKGTSEKIALMPSEMKSKTFIEHDNFDKFSLNIPADIGNLKSATLSIDGEIQHEWSISTLEILEENSKRNYTANINKKLNNENNELTVDLNEVDETKSSLNDSEQNFYHVTIKTAHKQLLASSTKLQLELTDENNQTDSMILTIRNDENESVEQYTFDTFTISSKEALGQLKAIKLSLLESKSEKHDLYQPESIEIFYSRNKKIYRIDCTEDDFLDSSQRRLELIKSITHVSRIRTQETDTLTTSSVHQPVVSAHDKLIENEDEDSFPLDDTNPSSNSQNHIQDVNSYSEKLTHTLNRRIRPGDRVKTNSIYHNRIPLLNKSNSYRHYSSEATRNRRNRKTTTAKAKHYQQRTNLLSHRLCSEERKTNQELSKSTIPLPKRYSSRSTQQRKPLSKFEMLSSSSLRTQANQSLFKKEIINLKHWPTLNIFDSNPNSSKRERNFNVQKLLINQKSNKINCKRGK